MINNNKKNNMFRYLVWASPQTKTTRKLKCPSGKLPKRMNLRKTQLNNTSLKK